MVDRNLELHEKPTLGQGWAWGRAWDWERRSGAAGWGTTLVLACLALGFTASAVQYERVRARSELERAGVLADASSEVEGQLEDLGKFMAEPGTRVIRLTESDSSPIASAAIAWNESEQRGYLLCDDLPALDPSMAYELWVRRGSDEPMRIAGIHSKAGMSVYQFRASGVKSRDRLEITAGPPSAGKSPILSGEFD
jgi:hypothetical protein